MTNGQKTVPWAHIKSFPSRKANADLCLISPQPWHQCGNVYNERPPIRGQCIVLCHVYVPLINKKWTFFWLLKKTSSTFRHVLNTCPPFLVSCFIYKYT